MTTVYELRMLQYLRWLRGAGWLVASHNDYRQGEAVRAYWSFSRGNQFVDGDGGSDAEALKACWTAAGALDC